MPDDDRDAFTWSGDDADETLVTGDDRADGDDASAAAAPGDAPVAAAPVPGTALVSILFLVLAVASAVGWIVVMLQNPAQPDSLVGVALYQLGELLSVLAAPLWWFVARRLAPQPVPWWIAGLLVTAPWPLVVGILA